MGGRLIGECEGNSRGEMVGFLRKNGKPMGLQQKIQNIVSLTHLVKKRGLGD